MPKKTSEEIREKVVALRKGGATYTQIEAQIVSPETGQKLARPTLIKILKEAGLTKAANAAAITPPPSSVKTPSENQSKPVPTYSSSDGVADFMPKQTVKVTTPKKKVEFQCQECGTEFIGDDGDELPETCPECGQ